MLTEHKTSMRSLCVLVALLGAAAAQVGKECVPRNFGFDSVACVCNATYCDEMGDVAFPDTGFFTVITSSRDGLRFSPETLAVQDAPAADSVVVRVDHNKEFQTMMGFGGAFTDSAGLNIVKLSEAAQENVMRSYFSPEGIEYTLCRIPIAGSDFSVRPYSYDDVEGDVALEHFALAEEDDLYKIPFILRAQELTRRPLQLFGSPWSPPAWMKTNGKFNESGELLKEMWQPYSDYFVKFVEAYEAAGIPMWGLTTQNEPLSGFDDNWGWNTCGWTAEDMRDWIKANLGPTLEAAGMRRLVLMIDDFNRDTLPWYPKPMLEDPASAQYIDGTAVHWYSDQWVGPSVMDETQMLFPDKFLLYTEACEGWDAPAEDSVRLGQWSRAEKYAHSILENINHFSTGWVDWNMALDMAGGPNWADNYVDSPIIINPDADEFYKQPSFYAMGHFSKFIFPGAKRVFSTTVSEEDVEVVAFHETSGRNVLVFHNRGEEAKNLSVADETGTYLNFPIPAKALQTVLF
ncbi:LOW QUALITY PROTEIN: lysosomal acid glucosylceramidase-like [Penaeus chinensis]|uniref:LOW QUALITY PROTEIN: lysosomal acid glucosylceramidase-like n=1 Tax=Penaeus chinensis TaxID=139456 RepID=UPI001FB7D22E|nr:LOW QUALITY PROTEIN: lysosomal acid glucosylceramidase-like [Penaeus chinensis]